jgi:hypothetical protein
VQPIERQTAHPKTQRTTRCPSPSAGSWPAPAVTSAWPAAQCAARRPAPALLSSIISLRQTTQHTKQGAHNKSTQQEQSVSTLQAGNTEHSNAPKQPKGEASLDVRRAGLFDGGGRRILTARLNSGHVKNLITVATGIGWKQSNPVGIFTVWG